MKYAMYVTQNPKLLTQQQNMIFETQCTHENTLDIVHVTVICAVLELL